jgi:hypothetical protein
MICRQYESSGRTDQTIEPVSRQMLEPLSLQQLALPQCIVEILDRWFWQRRREARRKCRVQCLDLLAEDAPGPTIRNDMVYRENQKVLALVNPEEDRTKKRSLLEIERLEHFINGQGTDV